MRLFARWSTPCAAQGLRSIEPLGLGVAFGARRLEPHLG